MAIKTIYVDVSGDGSGIDDIISLEITEGFSQTCARVSMEVRSYGTFDLNDSIVVDLGFSDDHAVLARCYIDTITATRRPGIYEIVGRDILKRAIDHFIVTTNLDEPWSRRNISAENLVGDLLAEAGITSYSGDTSNFTFGVSSPVEVNVTSSWDMIERLAQIIAWKCYAEDGTVYFKNVQPTPSGPAVATITTGDSGSITSIGYEKSTENLRNKVVVFGREGIYAEASAVSPYLPSGFYKTAIVSSEMIDSQDMAQDSADYNLALYNRLTETVRLDIEGDPSIRARDTVTVTESFTGVTGDWFVFSVTHRLDANGYTTTLHLVR